MKRIVYYLFTLALIFSVSTLFAQKNGSVEGIVKDAVSGELLGYTNVALMGTSIGTITLEDGSYKINNVPPGTYTLKASFVGYEEKSISITVRNGQVTNQDMELAFTTIMGEEVVITATARGQVKAINTQIAAKTIKNVVSEQKIRELPDANAAEALSRLPGVSVIRSGGEATSIKIRGVGTNTVYVNGMRMGGGLSGISASMIGGIEVSKAFMPDRDADVMGGIVDFKMREAKPGLKTEIWARTGYNGFTKSFKMHDVSALVSNRFLDDKLGVMVSMNWDRKDRGRDVLSASYRSVGSSENAYVIEPVKISGVGLYHKETLNDRYGATLYTDYRLRNGKLYGQAFFNRINSNVLQSTDRYTSEYIYYQSSDYTTNNYNVVSGVGGEHMLFDLVEVNWSASYSKNGAETPRKLGYSGRNRDGVSGLTSIDTTSTIQDWMAMTTHDMALTEAGDVTESHSESGGDALSTKLDIKLPFFLGQQISGFFKFGGKYRDISRFNDAGTFSGSFREDSYEKLYIDGVERLPDYGWTFLSNGYLGHEVFAVPESEWVQDFSILDAKTYYHADHEKVMYVVDNIHDKLTANLVGERNDYTNTEQFMAGYAMVELNVGSLITFTPGVRYEKNTHETTAKHFELCTTYGPMESQGVMYDTTAGNTITELFPMIHLKIKPLDWFDIRLAYTKTCSRPGFSSMSPRYYRSNTFNLSKGNVMLKPQINYNYDLYLSFYSRKLGLLTAGVFYKKMENQVLGYSVRIIDPADYGLTEAFQGKTLSYPVNNESPGYVRGLELDWQTQFSYLPRPFNGIVLNANFTYMQSETAYPFFGYTTVTIDEPPYRLTEGERTERVNKITGMPDMIGNVSLGYETGGFSGRISAYYQSRTITRAVASDISTDVDRDAVLRFDLQLSQSLKAVPGLVFYLNVNNLTNNPDTYLLTYHPDRITSEERYGTAADIGVRYRF